MGSIENIRELVSWFVNMVEEMEESGELSRAADALSTLLKTLVDSLIQKGFTRTEAMEIVCQMNFSSKK